MNPGAHAGPPIVSIAVPTYKGAALLPATIESVLAQTYPHWQLIIVDDCSPDGTATVVQRYAGDARIRYVRNERNLGPEASWNRGLELADGAFFKLLPHDDTLEPDCLRRQVEVLQADPDGQLSLVFCARKVIDEQGRVLARRGYPGGVAGRIPADVAIRACVRRGTNLFGEPGSQLVRTDLARRVGGYDATNPYVIDLDYAFRALAHGDAYSLPEPLVSFRVSPNQWSVVIGRRQADDFNAFVERVRRQLPGSLSALDLWCGRLMARLNGVARMVFYRLHFADR